MADSKTYTSLARALRRHRATLFKTVADTEADLQFIAEDRESELEERAQEERTARLFGRLDLRGKRAIEEIDAALKRIDDGTYGACAECGKKIPPARLRALPTARCCVACASARETRGGVAEAEEVAHAAPLPADLGLLTDREVESALRDLVRDDGRLDVEELRIVQRHGVVYLDGAVPSETEHRMLLKLLTDVAGLQEIVDRLQVKEILWAREDRSREVSDEAPPSRLEPSHTEDVVTSTEEGVDYVPPVEPPPEEE